ncbi:MAG TPA: HAD hydrolase family protein [Salinimicrobium sp.]|nr:HAD hydrolase family protein [Salinimicrobium sp.]
MKIKLIVSDVDGVWTDGSFYYSKEGDSIRKFTTKDSYGVSLCRLMKIPVLILSTEKNPMVKQRMKKLKVKHVQLGIGNKYNYLLKFCKKYDMELSEVAYVGDDMNDYHLLGKIGIFGCPADAYPKIKNKADLVLTTKGGNGVFREFVERLLEQEGLLEGAYKKYVEQCLKE